MNINRALYLLPCLLLFLFSCNEKEVEGVVTKDYLNVESEIVIGAQDTIQTFIIHANCQWSITHGNEKGDWTGLDITPREGNGDKTVTIKTPVNKKISERTDSIIVKNQNGSIAKAVTLRQQAGNTIISLSANNHTFTYEASNWTFTIFTNDDCDWTITGDADAKWLSCDKKSGTGSAEVTVSVTENDEDINERGTELTVQAADDSSIYMTIKIVQNPKPSLIVKPLVIHAATIADSYPIKIITNDTYIVSSNQAWLKSDITSGSGNATLMVTCEENTLLSSRMAQLTIASDFYIANVRITQDAASVPILSDLQESDVTASEANISGHYTSPLPVTEYGICYSAEPNPTIENTKVSFNGNALEGDITTHITGLYGGVTYYVRSYAINRIGTSYSKQLTFKTTGNRPDGGDNPYPETNP